MVEVGKRFAGDFSRGLASARVSGIGGGMAAPAMAGMGGAVGAGGGSSGDLHLTIMLDNQKLGEAVYRDINRRGLRNVQVFAR
jgi:hypothetical protein